MLNKIVFYFILFVICAIIANLIVYPSLIVLFMMFPVIFGDELKKMQENM